MDWVLGYVNNPKMSDVKFRVSGEVFYAHRFVLGGASEVFCAMLFGDMKESREEAIPLQVDLQQCALTNRTQTLLQKPF